MSPSQNKKGIEAVGFSIIIAIALLLLSGGVILAEVRYIASKLDESWQVNSCTLFNKLKFGLRETSSGVLTSGEPICNTIDKHMNKKSFVPTSKYKQDKEGAEMEIREMIKNCWSMWLDGSQKDMFREYPFREPCFTCYTFKIKENAKGITYKSLEKSLEEPLYVDDMSDKCAIGGGGYWRQNCNLDEEVVTSKKSPLNGNYKCCRKDAKNECENKGGKCSSQGKPSEEYGLYNKWQCSKREQSCYAQKGSLYSYTRYIRKAGPRGGDVFFKPSVAQESEDIDYIPGEIYAISFISPSKQICSGAYCYATIGAYVLTVVGGTIVLAKLSIVGGAVTIIGKLILKVAGGNILATYAAYQLSILDNLVKGGINLVTSRITIDVPNFIVVSTLSDAKEELGCTISYAE